LAISEIDVLRNFILLNRRSTVCFLLERQCLLIFLLILKLVKEELLLGVLFEQGYFVLPAAEVA